MLKMNKHLWTNVSQRLKFLSTTSSTNATASINDEWNKLAQKQLKGQSPDTLVWPTAEVVFEL